MSIDHVDTIKVLDKGYVKYIGHMGSDETIIEAARMSTGKGFLGWYWQEDTWASHWCGNCETQHDGNSLPATEDGLLTCTNCWTENILEFEEENSPDPKLLGKKGEPRDLNLLEYLYSNKHSTPFEMGEVCIEVKAPIEVFRQWHRHRMQSYNEFSARYSQMPNEHYIPDISRMSGKGTGNKQASTLKEMFDSKREGSKANSLIDIIAMEQQGIYDNYENLLEAGVPKEVARINTPVSRYSKMRAKTDVRNWLGFLALRMEVGAQWEIRQYANAVATIVKELFPRTFELFLEYDLLGERFSRTEMKLLRGLVTANAEAITGLLTGVGMSPKQGTALLKKFNNSKEDLYKEVLEKL